jgi:hypothetical protein
MQSPAKRKATDDPHDFVVVSSDQVRVAPSDTDELTDLLRAAARQHSESDNSTAPDRPGSAPVPMVDTTFRATAVNDAVPARRTTFGRRAMRAIAALVLTLGLGAAALTWQTFGYAAKKAAFKWAPKFAISASLPLEKLGLSAKSPPADDPAGADATPAQAASPAEGAVNGAPENDAPGNAVAGNTLANPAASSSDPAQLLQSMARDLANVSQEVEILKASIAELKASQQQTTRDLAKVSDKTSEQSAKAKMITAPPRPAVAAVHKPAPIYSPTATPAPPPPAYRPAPSYSPATQAAAPPPAPSTAAQPYVPPPPIPLQPQAEPGFAPPRPPMPVQ